MSATKTSVRVRGVTYRSPDEARVAADEIEHHAEEVADELRAGGKDAQAEQVFDRGNADAEKLRAFARDLEAGAAAKTEQPPDRPKAPKRKPSTRSRGDGSTRRTSTPATRQLKVAQPRASRTLSRGYRRSGAQAYVGNWSQIGWQLVALTIGVALLILILTPRGVDAFKALTGSVAGGLKWILDPVDPLSPRIPAATQQQLQSIFGWGSTTSTPANRRPARNAVMR